MRAGVGCNITSRETFEAGHFRSYFDKNLKLFIFTILGDHKSSVIETVGTNCVAVEKENSMCHPIPFLYDVEWMGAIKISISLARRTKQTSGLRQEVAATRFGFSQHRTHVWRHVSVPESQGCPVDIQQEGGIMLPKAWHQVGGERRGELQVLVGKQQRSDGGVHTGEGGRRQSWRWKKSFDLSGDLPFYDENK